MITAANVKHNPIIFHKIKFQLPAIIGFISHPVHGLPNMAEVWKLPFF